MDNQFTITDLIKHMLRNAWWIIVLGIIGGGAMYVMNKQPAVTSYSASRNMYVGKSDSDVKDPNSRIMGNSWMLKTYRSIGKDRQIIEPAVKQLKKQHVKVTANELRQAISLSTPDSTLLINAQVHGIKKGNQAVKMVNAYTGSFAVNGPKLISNMPQPELMSAAKKARADSIVSGSPKKSAAFGLVAGVALGIVLAFFTGIFKNFKTTKA